MHCHTDPFSGKDFGKFPHAVVLSATMEGANFIQYFFKINLGLLGPLPQRFKTPTRLLAEKLEQQIQQLIPRQAGHAFEGTFDRFWFGFLIKIVSCFPIQ